MKPIDLETAESLIDYGGIDNAVETSFAEEQLRGSVVAFNMLARNRVAYLADEVGLGKTFVALGVMAMLRHFQPDARILVIAPRENLQRKWIKERENFIRHNWRVHDGRVKSLDDLPARSAVFCPALRDWLREMTIDDQRDVFLRLPSFSLALVDADSRRKVRSQIQSSLAWIDRSDLPIRTYEGFLESLGRTLNDWLPEIDLLVVDEAHNLKQGVPRGSGGTVRNRLLASVFGSPTLPSEDGRPRRRLVRRVLLLSATPFESDYRAIQNQFDLFGRGDARLHAPGAESVRRLTELTREEETPGAHRELVSRLMLRRIASLRVAGETWTKNMYRREWRRGGYTVHDQPIEISDARQRLVIGLMQKKVSEVLQDESFGNRFQIGMLSSFESFLETVALRRRRIEEARAAADDTKTTADEPATFEGDQDASQVERKGIDTDALADVVLSHRDRFDRGLPHPKLDTTAEALGDVFRTGEKALVFVRRVATVRELGDKLAQLADEWLYRRMIAMLPDLTVEIDRRFASYRNERRRSDETHGANLVESAPVSEPADVEEELTAYLDDDEGGLDSFFAWFFRGKGPEGILSGAAFQKNRLSGIGSVYSTLFEDDWVGWLLGRPTDVVDAFAGALGRSRGDAIDRVRRRSWARFRGRTKRERGYPRLQVFEAYQFAALQMLSELEGELAQRAGQVLHDRFPGSESSHEPMPDGYPGIEVGLGVRTVFTELEKRTALRQCLWPEEAYDDFRRTFRRRETRRELFSAMARLGAPYVDLYLLAMRHAGSFELGPSDATRDRSGELIDDWLDLLEAHVHEPGFHGYHELEAAAATFDTILAVNFHEAPAIELWSLAKLFSATLQKQTPIGGMAGKVNHRLVRQFRMPGFPLVLVTTDVLQEGEDLHTFCRRVIHYGISWTPSAMEQRTGRVDRIGSLAQRELDLLDEVPDDQKKIQVHFPHLRDTVEVFQVRRVLRRMSRFLHLIHENETTPESRESHIDVGHEVAREEAEDDLAPVLVPLRSAFPVQDAWLLDGSGPHPIARLDEPALARHLAHLWSEFQARFDCDPVRTGAKWRYEGVLWFDEQQRPLRRGDQGARARHQHFKIRLHPGRVEAGLYLECESEIGEVDPTRDDVVEQLDELQRTFGLAKLALKPVGRGRSWLASVARSILFDPSLTQYEEFERLVHRVVGNADRFERQLLGVDADLTEEGSDDA